MQWEPKTKSERRDSYPMPQDRPARKAVRINGNLLSQTPDMYNHCAQYRVHFANTVPSAKPTPYVAFAAERGQQQSLAGLSRGVSCFDVPCSYESQEKAFQILGSSIEY
jgi:hypothetical protein